MVASVQECIAGRQVPRCERVLSSEWPAVHLLRVTQQVSQHGCLPTLSDGKHSNVLASYILTDALPEQLVGDPA